MGLSDDLISQFAKITKDTKTVKQESTIYGTVVVSSGESYVKFDGSDLLTPVIKTVDVKNGDRVSVLLKNHTATITGNITSPAARIETVNVVVNNIDEMNDILENKVGKDDLDNQNDKIDEIGADALAASKVATDFLSLSSSGLVVGQNPTNPNAGNTLISADGVSIRKGTTILASFKAAFRTTTGISSAVINSSDITDSESDGTTSVNGTVNKNETRANIYISTNGNPVYFPNGIETDKVLINNSSGIISNSNMVLNGSLVDSTGEGIFTPINSYGNTIIGYGRFEDGGGTHIYGNRVKAKTKAGFSASVNGSAAIDTNNSSGNATFGWHLYDASKGETNIYGNIASLIAKEAIRINANGKAIHLNGSFVPYTADTFDLGTGTSPMRNIYISMVNKGSNRGLRFSNNAGTAYNAVGVNADGYQIYGNSSYVTNIVSKSTTTTNTGYSFKILCGENPALTIEDSDARLLLFGGTDSTSRYLGSIAAYKRTYTNAANMFITNNGIIGRSTSSSERYKTDISVASIDELKGLYDLPVKKFKYKNDYIASDDELYDKYLYGFIVEDLNDILPCSVQHISGEPEMWNNNIIVPSLLKLIQDLNNRLKLLEEKGA